MTKTHRKVKNYLKHIEKQPVIGKYKRLWQGYTILNIIDKDTTINKYGLYTNYYDGYNNWGVQYILKPIDYKKQKKRDTYYYGKTLPEVQKLELIGSDDYYYNAFRYHDVFPIK